MLEFVLIVIIKVVIEQCMWIVQCKLKL